MPECGKVLNCSNIERLFVRSDAPAILLEEINALSPDYKQKRRYQRLHFVDGQNIYHHQQDVGPVIDRAGFILPAGGVDERNGRIRSWYDVAEIRAVAEEFRLADETEWEIMARTPEVEDFEELYQDEADRRKLAVSKKGHFGPKFSVMR